jgi:hypothetical protein
VAGPRSLLVSVGTAIIAMLAGAAHSGLLLPAAAAQVARRPEDEHDSTEPLLLKPAEEQLGGAMLAHRSHSSHRSHRSHSSHRSHYSGSNHSSGYVPQYAPLPERLPAPPPPRPATVSFVAFPGGRIFVDGQLRGSDGTSPITLNAGSHTIRVQNRFLGDKVFTITLHEGQTGVVTLEW